MRSAPATTRYRSCSATAPDTSTRQPWSRWKGRSGSRRPISTATATSISQWRNRCTEDTGSVGTVQVLRGDGAGGLTADPGFPVAGFFARYLAIGDFDRDGRPDVAVPAFTSALSAYLSVMQNMCGDVVDLSVAIAESTDPVLIPGELTYTVTITNTSNVPADVRLSSLVNNAVDLRSTQPSSGICVVDRPVSEGPDATRDCYLGRLTAVPPGNTATVTFVVVPSTFGSFQPDGHGDHWWCRPAPLGQLGDRDDDGAEAWWCKP